MKWLWRLMAAVLVGMVVLLLVIWGALSSSVGVRWISEQTLRALIDPKLTIRGDASLQLMPVLAFHATDVQVQEDLDSVPESCLAGKVDREPSSLAVSNLHIMADWRGILSKKLDISGVELSNVILTRGLRPKHGPWQSAGMLGQMENRDWKLKLNELVVKNLEVHDCVAGQANRQVLGVRQVRAKSMPIDPATDPANTGSGHALESDRVELVVDDIDATEHLFPATTSQILQKLGYMRDGVLKVETLRSQWLVSGGMADLESMKVISQGPVIEQVSGKIDFSQDSIDIQFVMQDLGSGRVLKIPGVDVILRNSTIPVRLIGRWDAPQWIVGAE